MLLLCVYMCVVVLMCVLLHSEPAPSAMSALHHFGAEMLRLSRGLEASAASKPTYRGYTIGIYLLAKLYVTDCKTFIVHSSLMTFFTYKYWQIIHCIIKIVLQSVYQYP